MNIDRWAAIFSFIALAGVILIPLLVPVSIAHKGRSFHAWWDFAHVPAFTLFTWGLLVLMIRRKARRLDAQINRMEKAMRKKLLA